MLCRKFKYDFDKMRHAGEEELVAVDGIGGVLAQAWMDYFALGRNNQMVDRLLAELNIEKEQPEIAGEAVFEGNELCDGRVRGAFCKPKELQELI